MNAFKAESLSTCMKTGNLVVLPILMLILHILKNHGLKHTAMHVMRAIVLLKLFEKDLMSVCGFHGLNEDDLNALVDVLD